MAKTSWKSVRYEFSKELMSNAKGVNRATQQILINATDAFLDEVQMNKEMLPYYTGNLHDSIATAVSSSGHIIHANYMPAEATKPQRAPGRKRIWGKEEAYHAIMRLHTSRGIYASLVVAVPYAQKRNEMGFQQGFLDSLQSNFEHNMESALYVLEKYPNARPLSGLKRRFE